MAPPASARSLALGRLALVTTGVSWLACLISVVRDSIDNLSLRLAIENLGFALIVTVLALSAIAYLVTRQGYLRRTRSHVRAARAEIDAYFDRQAPSTTVLIPSYREQPEVILQTMLSAAIQELPDLRVVLLIDNPPQATDPEHRRILEAARAIPDQVAAMLEEPRTRFAAALDQLKEPGRAVSQPTDEELCDLVGDYELAAAWLSRLADNWVRHDHTDDFFADHVLGALAADLSVVAAAVRGAVLHHATVHPDRFRQLRRRLVAVFTAKLTSFERKQYLTLSAEPNKAMNLNAYLGLMGGSYSVQHTSAGRLLLPCPAGDPDATIHVPRTDYVVTLDADSVLLSDYGFRLVHAMGKPGNQRIGVIQTPYSAFPGAPTRVERLAGATTDVQHIVHQGMAEHDAAFWVGANAVLRADAFETLRVDDDSEGHTVSRFISDRTVIEDTESTLDLTSRGWKVVNYPERLAYSASPPDFGSLCVQRQRWANGGLIIIRKLAGHWRAKKERGEPRHLAELLLRLNYLASIAWATGGLILLLAYPFRGELTSGLVVLMSVPYFVVMASDLKRCGYKHTDVVRVYGFNLIMLPVNATGVVRSLVQMVTGHKAAFGRTPKVRHRSVAPPAMVIGPYLVAVLAGVVLYSDIYAERWVHAAFAATNLFITVPAIIALIGLRNSVIDVAIGLTHLLFKPARTAPAKVALDPVLDWRTVLYHGSVERPRTPHRDTAIDDDPFDLAGLPDAVPVDAIVVGDPVLADADAVLAGAGTGAEAAWGADEPAAATAAPARNRARRSRAKPSPLDPDKRAAAKRPTAEPEMVA